MNSVTSSASTELRKTRLNATHRRMGAKMANFGGWDMPVEYPATGGLLAEHRAVRSGVGLFDVSHMGDIRVRSGRTAGGGRAPGQSISRKDGSQLLVGQGENSPSAQ